MAESEDVVVIAHRRDNLTAEQVGAIGEAARRFMDDPARYPGMAEQEAAIGRVIARIRKLRHDDRVR